MTVRRCDVDIKALITDTHGAGAAEAWAVLTLDQTQREALCDAGRQVLQHFPPRPGACMLMSAIYAMRLESMKAPPAYVVAGSVYAAGKRVFGEDGPINGKERFSRSDPSWEGHGWIISGNYLADASIFRTAYSPGSPRALAAHVKAEFGTGRGLLVCKIEDAIKSGLRYQPQYVLAQGQVDALFRAARHLQLRQGARVICKSTEG
jgi:hypothetical protein